MLENDKDASDSPGHGVSGLTTPFQDRLKIRGVQILAFGLSGTLAFLLRFDFSISRPSVPYLRFAIPVWVGTTTLIYGAGKAGQALVREIRLNSHLRYAGCGFVHDDSNKHGAILNGVTVLGSGSELASLVRKLQFRKFSLLVPIPAVRFDPDSSLMQVGRRSLQNHSWHG